MGCIRRSWKKHALASKYGASMVNVPSAYQPLVQQMSAATGLPYNVIAAQAEEESGFDATAVSSAGAEGWLQFLPSTYQEYAQQAGVGQNTEFNPPDEAQVYDVYMSALLKTENGNVEKALEAYNAGFEPGSTTPNPAGLGYAQAILSNAGQNANLNASGGSGTANLDSIINPSSLLSGIGGDIESGVEQGAEGIISNYWNMFLAGFKVNSLKDLAIRAGLILLGAIILILSIKEFISAGSMPVQTAQDVAKAKDVGEFVTM
jgi:hypothetical protein